MVSIWDVIPEIDVQGLLRKIPRPERGGVLSVILHYSLLISLLTAGAAVDPDIRCLLHPASCQQQETAESLGRKWKVVYLYHGSRGGKKVCTCGAEERYIVDGEIQYYSRESDWAYSLPTCDNDFTDEIAYFGKDWKLDFEDKAGGEDYVIQTRWHCSNDKDTK